MSYGVRIDRQTADEVFKAVQSPFKTMGIPRSVYTDEGSEFKGKVHELYKGEGVTHRTTVTHAHVVERFVRTVKRLYP